MLDASPAARQPKLSVKLSASLDAARAVAAGYVVLHHVALTRGWANGPGLALRFGDEAVMVFFLLSGFVIFANERTRATRPAGYYLRRLRRIYPALVAALLVSKLIAVDNGTFFSTFSYKDLLGTLASLQDIASLKPGVIVDPYLQNFSLWSLSYEVGFYLAFPLVLRFWLRFPSWADHGIGVACCLAYILFVLVPNHWSLVTSYFLLWWCGAMAANAYLKGARDARSMTTPLYWLLCLALLAAAAVFFVGYRGLGYYPFLMLRHFAVALVILVVLFGPIGSRIASVLVIFARPAAAVASISYGLYVLHVPLVVDWNRANGRVGLLAAVVVLAAAAYLVDRGLNRVLPRAPKN
jgi:peptidoglycan/LPS O-acetylase OafA/YrhL